MTHLHLTKPIAFIDVETTGINTREDRIVDICIIKILPNGEKETLKSIINSTISIPVESTKIHGITDIDVQGKPTFREFASKVTSFIDGCDLCGFNIIGFDLGILQSEFQRAEFSFSSEGRKIIDVMKIYHKLEPRDLNAAHLKYCGKSLENVHKAEADVNATICVLEAQLEKHNDLPRNVSELDEFCNPKDPSWIDNEGKFAWLNGKAIINFGKYKGKTFEFVSQNDSSYFQWIIRGDFSAEVKDIANNAINGKFPEKLNC
ncbi:3'-5' exonuclease [Candidatus Woesearchaeota archaeon]|nr:3'-5' exonuclease [Candidatus Woesearchaeota archaeon]